jgi:hypothetical protein
VWGLGPRGSRRLVLAACFADAGSPICGPAGMPDRSEASSQGSEREVEAESLEGLVDAVPHEPGADNRDAALDSPVRRGAPA